MPASLRCLHSQSADCLLFNAGPVPGDLEPKRFAAADGAEDADDGSSGEEEDDGLLPWQREGLPPRERLAAHYWFRFRELCLKCSRSPLYDKFSMSIIILNTIDMCLVWCAQLVSHLAGPMPMPWRTAFG